MDIVETFLDFYGERERMARTVVGRLLDGGFSYALLRSDGREADIQSLMIEDFEKHRGRIHKYCAQFNMDKGGWIEIRYHGKMFMRVLYRMDGRIRYRFGDDGKDAARALSANKAFFLSVRKDAETFLDEDFLTDALTLACCFLDRVPESGYRLEGCLGAEKVAEGVWLGDRMEVEVLKLGAFFDSAILALQGLDFGKVSRKSTVDLMRFFSKMREGLRRVAGVLTTEGHRLEVVAGGKPIYRTGKGVKPAPSDAYGNTEIRIDHVLDALAAERARS